KERELGGLMHAAGGAIAATCAATGATPLQIAQNLLGPARDGLRDARQSGDMDAVAAVGAARHDLVEEGHALPVLFHRYVEVADPRQHARKLDQLVVVGGEEGATAKGRSIVD